MHDRMRRPVSRYDPNLPPFQRRENAIRLTLGWVIDRSFTAVAQLAAPSKKEVGVSLEDAVI